MSGISPIGVSKMHANPILLPAASFVNYFDACEQHERMGVRFYRSFVGLEHDRDIEALDNDDIIAALRVNFARFANLAIERDGAATKKARKSFQASLQLSYPQIKRAGITFRDNLTAKPNARMEGCEHIFASGTFGNISRSCVISFGLVALKKPDSILDPTKILLREDEHDPLKPRDSDKPEKPDTVKYNKQWVNDEIKRVNALGFDSGKAYAERAYAIPREYAEIIAMYRMGILSRKPYPASPWDVSEDVLPAYTYAERDANKVASSVNSAKRVAKQLIGAIPA